MRSDSCRSTTSATAARSASTSRCPVSRTASGMLYAGESVSNWLRNHIRCCASDSGTRSGRGRGAERTGAVGRPARCDARSRAARPATVGASNSARTPMSVSERRVQPRDDPGRDQRVAAEVEEVVVDADPVDAEHLGEDAGDRLLEPASSAARNSDVRRRTPARAAPCGPACRWGQRDLVEDHDRGRHHVARAAVRRRTRVSVRRRRPPAPSSGST